MSCYPAASVLKYHGWLLNLNTPIYTEKLSDIQTGFYFGKILVLLDLYVKKLLLSACNITGRILNIHA